MRRELKTRMGGQVWQEPSKGTGNSPCPQWAMTLMYASNVLHPFMRWFIKPAEEWLLEHKELRFPAPRPLQGWQWTSSQSNSFAHTVAGPCQASPIQGRNSFWATCVAQPGPAPEASWTPLCRGLHTQRASPSQELQELDLQTGRACSPKPPNSSSSHLFSSPANPQLPRGNGTELLFLSFLDKQLKNSHF